MKRINKVFKYMAHEAVRPMAIFYLVVALIIALAVTMKLVATRWNIEFEGMRFATTVFLFVAGLNSFKPGYLTLQAYGVTRRHFFFAGLLAIAALAVVMTGIDTVLFGVLHQYVQPDQKLPAALYPGSGALALTVWFLALNLLAVALGWFVTMLYYRCGKGLKIAISLAPAVLFIVMTIVSDATGGLLIGTLADAFAALMGRGSPLGAWLGAISLLAAAAACAGLCYLLVRRAPVKEQDR